MKNPTRLFDFPRYQLENCPQEVMMSMPNAGQRLSYSTKEFVEEIDRASRGLISLGVEVDDKVALISHNNRCEWNVMDHGIMQAGGIDVPIYPTMTEADYKYILNHSESKYCFVSNKEIWDKVNAVKGECPNLLGVYTFEQVDGADSWKKVLEAGDAGGSGEKKEGLEVELTSRRDAIKGDQLATIIYTSGTTGLPKGVMLSHDNVCTNALTAVGRVPLEGIEGELRVLSFLPVCHIFERMLHYLYIYMGANIYFGEGLETIKEDLNHAQPVMFTAVPRLLEKFFDGIVAKGRAAGGVKAAIFNWALGVVLEWEPEKEGRGMYGVKLKVARKLVFSKVKEALGMSGIKAVASGSAALQARLARFFNGAGIPVLEGYGLTETSPVVTVNTVNSPGMLRIGTVGKVVDEVEVGFASDEEILVRGPNVMIGYYKDQAKTDEVIKDGWFHTGDKGELDPEGFLKITGRKKEIFKTSGGKYVAPALLENALKASLFIEQVMVVGENQKHPSALVSPDTGVVREWCKRHNHQYPEDEKIGEDSVIAGKIMEEVDRLMKPFSKWEQVKVIRIIAEPFTIEGGELTPTLKLKREPIKKKYGDLIDGIYN